MPHVVRAALVAALLAGLMGTRHSAAQDVTPPGQPATGPGGADYAFDVVRAERHGVQPTGYWLFEPDEASLADLDLRVVLFLHGYTATDPTSMRAWIDHLVRLGNVVVFPDYQLDDPLGESPLEYVPNMIEGVSAAIAELEGRDQVPTGLDRLTVVGYSMGGVLGLNYAAMAADLDLPVPSAVMAVTPGGCRGCDGPGGNDFGVPYRDLSRIDPATKLLVVTGEDDDFVGQRPAEVAWEATGQIPDENRDYLVVRTDRHGAPALVADHFFPSAAADGSSVDALDWRGTWKWLDGLMACDVDASVCGEVTNGGATQLDMGTWGDGMAVAPPVMVEEP